MEKWIHETIDQARQFGERVSEGLCGVRAEIQQKPKPGSYRKHDSRGRNLGGVKVISTEEHNQAQREDNQEGNIVEEQAQHADNCNLAGRFAVTRGLTDKVCHTAHADRRRDDIDERGRSREQRKPAQAFVHVKHMIERAIDQSHDPEPGKLDQNRQQDKPKISIPKSSYDAFEFTKTEIHKRGAEEEDQDEEQFPHIREIIHKHPRALCIADVF